MGLMLPPTRAPFMMTPTGSAGPAPSSRTRTHVHQAASRAGRRIDTARRASGDATASSPISWAPFPYVYERIASLVTQKNLKSPPPLRAQLEQFLAVFRQRATGHGARTMGPDSHRDPEAWCSRTGKLQARTAEVWCPRTGTLQDQIPSTASDGLASSAFDPSLEYSRDYVVLFWQPLSYVLQWSPSSLVVDGVSYSRAEQVMVAEKARLFKDPSRTGAHHVVARSTNTHTHRSRRAQL